MPYKSLAQAAYFNIHRKELEREGVDVDEWNDSTRGKKLPKKLKKKAGLLDVELLLKQASADFKPDYTPDQLKEMGVYKEVYGKKYNRIIKGAEDDNMVKNFGTSLALHRGIDTGATNVMRRGPLAPLLGNYYANAAKEGLRASVDGIDVMPRWRRGLGVLSPSLTGLTDYEIARDVGHNVQDHANQYGQKINSVEELTNHPLFRNAIDGVDKRTASPITRNIINAVDPNLKPNPVVNFAKRFGGMGSDVQHASSRLRSKRIDNGGKFNENELAIERIANNNAINFMREQKVPSINIQKYISDLKKGYKSYLYNYKTLQTSPAGSFTSPAGSFLTPFSEIPKEHFSVDLGNSGILKGN